MGAASFLPNSVRDVSTAIKIQFRQCFVDEMISFQPIGQAGANILFQVYFDVVGFAGFNGRNFFHGFVFRLLNYTGNPVTIGQENFLEDTHGKYF